MIKAIFFDVGGVIIEEKFRQGVMQYEKEFNIPMGEFYKIVHDHQGWIDFTLGKISEKEYLRFCENSKKGYIFNKNRYIELLEEFMKPNIEVVNYIKFLSKSYIIGIISNNPKEWFDRFITKAKLENEIKIKAVSGYVHIRKPDKKIFQIALNQTNAKPRESIYVDDRSDRIYGAKKIGMNIIIFDGDVARLKKEIKKFNY
ncbi:HAD-IA family hydrolase [Patescibacteria group bacterium]|nr:HAD-IA family hydrolase [Patescibacteria group bacterium]MBU4600954.1 HAD-IA family hydrolase [Patescibacteria group bacterium]MCG2697976.1 HAD-IA family hydrolase [Candidatus Parcubacteria bacterium]MCG2699910.1 HAD-IA family hydrolase [Candidatus Parcubacteria bacterium]